MESRQLRQQTLSDARRALVLDAARAVFDELGIEGASIREIARRAGYTPGAIYSYFESKEAMYGVLLAESLDRLHQAVGAAGQGDVLVAGQRLLLKSQAWFGFYANNPRDLDLGFYLVHGMRPRGLTVELNSQLNHRLLEALQPCEVALSELGLTADLAQRENAALFAHGMGLLLLQHTGRIRVFGQNASELFRDYTHQLLARIAPGA